MRQEGNNVSVQAPLQAAIYRSHHDSELIHQTFRLHAKGKAFVINIRTLAVHFLTLITFI